MINSKTTILLLSVLLLTCCEKKNPFPEGGEDTRRDYTSTTGVDTFGEENIFCRNVCLYRNVQMQGFDLSSDRKTVWYVQNWYQTLVWNKGFPDNKQGISYQNTEYMTLQYFGHATTFSVEEEGNERYLWLGAYGTPNDSEYHLYFNEKVLCRVKFVAGKTVNTAQADDYYYIGEYTNMHPAIDPENGLICINYQDNTGNNANRRCFVVYKFNEVKKAPLKDITISCGDAFKTGNATSQNITSTVVKCHDLTTLTPVARFSFPKTKYGAGDNPVFYDWQGFEFHKDRLYYYEGDTNYYLTGNVDSPSYAYLTIFDDKGRLVEKRTQVAIAADSDAQKQYGLGVLGCMEAEGLKVRGNDLYIGFGTQGYSVYDRNYYNQIFKFKATKK